MSATSTLLTVTELTHLLKNLLESKFTTLSLQGEISNFKPNSSGHLYFDLKDSGAKVAAVMFKNATGSLARLPKEGDSVIVRGSLSLYAPHGRYQIVVQSMQFAGIGELLLKLEELKKKLHSQGWFDAARKKKLPSFPKTIGVVTSPTGAVIKDIINVLSRRCKGFHLILYPVPVQGVEAAPAIAAAINELNRLNLVDVMIVGRGGGSLEDLWPFNEEIVATAIYNSRIPIVSAVGHETDFTIADFVADIRAPTPSAAAEIVSSETLACLDFLKKMQSGVQSSLSHLLKRYQERLKRYTSHPIFSTSYTLTGPYFQRIDDLKKEVDSHIYHHIKEKKLLLIGKRKELIALNPKTQLSYYRNKLKEYEKRIDLAISHQLNAKEKDLKQLCLSLKSLDPKNVLKRGYSILFAVKKSSVIVSAKQIETDDEVEAIVADGKLTLKVTNART